MISMVTGFRMAVPLMIIVGPVAILLIEHGMRLGVRGAWSAPFAVATGDIAYATVAASAGAGLHRVLRGNQHELRLVAGCALIAVGVYIARGIFAPNSIASTTPEAGAGAATVLAPSSGQTTLAARFFGLVTVNPLTILAFASLAIAAGPNVSLGWVIGVGIASLVVHSTWLVLGHVAGSMMSPKLLTATRVAGCLTVLALGVSSLA